MISNQLSSFIHFWRIVPTLLFIIYTINIVSTKNINIDDRLKIHLGNLNRVKQIAMVKGKILAQSNFTGHTLVVDGCSAFLVYIFGEDIVKHARTMDGLGSLSFNITLAVEMIVERK